MKLREIIGFSHDYTAFRLLAIDQDLGPRIPDISFSSDDERQFSTTQGKVRADGAKITVQEFCSKLDVKMIVFILRLTL